MMRSANSLGRQLAFTLAISLGIGLLLILALITWQQLGQEREKRLGELQAMAEVIAFNATAVIEFRDTGDAEQLFKSLDRHGDIVHGQLISADGSFSYGYVRKEAPLPELSAFEERFDPDVQKLSDLKFASVRVPVRLHEETTGFVQLTASLAGVWASFMANTAIYLAGVLAAFVLALLVGRRFLFAALAPLRQLTQFTHDVTESRDFSRRVGVAGADEIQEMADAFNAMLAEIEARNGELQKKAVELSLIAQEANNNAVRAEEASRAKSAFLATMSHEIRTPMNGILGMAQVLLMKESSEENRLQCARTILSSGEVLLTLLNDLLDLAKVESGNIRLDATDFSPNDLIHETLLVFSGAAERKSLRLRAEPLPAPPRQYHADATRLRQMLANLVSNALKFTAAGEVVVEVHELVEEDGSASLEFAVRDTGIGIADDKLALLFRPFSQVDASITRQFGGTGLGLSIVRQLAELMGGSAGVTSAPGQGSRFWFRIPAAAATAGTLAGDVQHAAEPARFTGHVLLAEDNLINQHLFATLLQRLGLSLDVVDDGEKAIEKFAAGHRYDLVMMDLQMPRLDGISSAREIRAREAATGASRTPIVAVTANVFAGDRERCLAAGMDGFIAKPVKIAALTSELSRWLSKVPPAPAPAGPPAGASVRRVDPAVVGPLVEELLPQLDSHLFDALRHYQSLAQAVAGSDVEAELAAIGQALEVFAFDKAAAQLRSLALTHGWIVDA